MKKKILGLVISSFLVLVSYQNCADVSLELVEPSVVLNSKFAGEFCSKTTEFEKLDVKLVFVLDMSSSNVEAQNDLDGERIELVKDLLSSLDSEDSCFFGSNLEVAVVGFAAQIIGGSSTQICTASRFVSPNQALSHLADYKQIHDSTRSNYENGGMPQANLGATSYIEGVNCVEKIIKEDLPAAPDNSGVLYQSFFLTDGDPTDGDQADVNRIQLLSQTLSATINSIRSEAQDRAFGMNFQPVLYGGLVEDNGTNTPIRQKALQVLGAMATAGGTFIRTAEEVGGLDFCGLANSGTNTTFKVKRFGAINLTARAEGGRLLPDSDMDGIVDTLEKDLGYDPQRARSQYAVLDGICKNGICDGTEDISTCQGLNAVGLSECDVDKLNLSDGLDSDKDLIPDFVEILKGIDPIQINDNYRNSDNDGLQNYTEILQGSDPLSYDESFDKDLLMRYSVQKSLEPFSYCALPQESWSFTLDYIPLVPTLATNNQDVLSLSKDYLNHEAGENVIFVYYIVAKELEEGQDREVQYLYGEYIKVTPNRSIPQPNGFRFLGELDGSFKIEGP